MNRIAFVLATLLVLTPALARSVEPGPAVPLEPPEQIETRPPGQVGGIVGTGVAVTVQATSFTLAALWAAGEWPGGTYGLIPVYIADIPFSVVGIAAFEDAAGGPTVAGRMRARGAALIESAAFAFSMTGILGLGLLRFDRICASSSCFEDLTPLFVLPAMRAYTEVGLAYLGFGVGFAIAADLAEEDLVMEARHPVRLRPGFAAGPDGVSFGLSGTF